MSAARVLTDALAANPYVLDMVANPMREAMEMDPLEIRLCMGRLRNQVQEYNVYAWEVDFLSRVFKLG